MARPDPEVYLRLCADDLVDSLARDDAARRPDDNRRGSTVGRVGAALVLVGALPEDVLERVLADLVLMLGLRGLPGGSLEPAGSHALEPREPARVRARQPELVVDCGLRCSLTACDLRLGWLVRTASRTFLHADAREPRPAPAIGPRRGRLAAPAIDDLVVADDAGNVYHLEWGAHVADDEGVIGEALLVPALPRDAAWLELRAPKGDAVRILLAPARRVRTGREDSAWTLPAERYLAHLALLGDGSLVRAGWAAAGAADTEHVEERICDAFVELGLVDPEHAAVRGLRGERVVSPGAGAEVPERSGISDVEPSAGRETGDARYASVALGAELPLERVGLVLEGATLVDDELRIWVHLSPVSPGWPAPLRSSRREEDPPWLRAHDERGRAYEPVRSRWFASDGGATAELAFAPRLDGTVQTLRVIAETPYEAAWAEVEVPER